MATKRKRRQNPLSGKQRRVITEHKRLVREHKALAKALKTFDLRIRKYKKALAGFPRFFAP